MLRAVRREEYKDRANERMAAIGRECEGDDFTPDRQIPYVGLTLGAAGSTEADEMVQHFSRALGFHLEPQGSLLSVLVTLAASGDQGELRNWSAVEMGRQRHLAAQAQQLLDSIQRLKLEEEYGGAGSVGLDHGDKGKTL